MIDFLIKILAVVTGLNMLVCALHAIIYVISSSSSKISEADQDPDDQFDVREEWKDQI